MAEQSVPGGLRIGTGAHGERGSEDEARAKVRLATKNTSPRIPRPRSVCASTSCCAVAGPRPSRARCRAGRARRSRT